MFVFLLLLHGLVAVFLLGSLSHQVLALWPPKDKKTFVNATRAVRPNIYVNATIIAFVITVALGGYIYTDYRLSVRIALEDMNMRAANGFFELKEHYAIMGMMLLPSYWYYWHQPTTPTISRVRGAHALILLLTVIASYVIGHYINNIRGL